MLLVFRVVASADGPPQDQIMAPSGRLNVTASRPSCGVAGWFDGFAVARTNLAAVLIFGNTGACNRCW